MVNLDLKASFSLNKSIAEEIKCPDCLKLFSHIQKLEASIEAQKTVVEDLKTG